MDAPVHARANSCRRACDQVRSCVGPVDTAMWLPPAVMEIRGTGANQFSELFALGASVLFLVPISPIIRPCRS